MGLLGYRSLVAKAGGAPTIIEMLLASDEPSIVWKTRVHVLGESSTSKTNQALAKAVQSSPRVKTRTCAFHDLVERLMHWRWPDGGRNYDKDPNAKKSTFIRTLDCMRGLHLYGTRYRDKTAECSIGALNCEPQVERAMVADGFVSTPQRL